jgi:hypothetical protein
MQMQNGEDFAAREACTDPTVLRALDARQRVHAQRRARRCPVALTRSGSNGFSRHYEQRLLSAQQC